MSVSSTWTNLFNSMGKELQLFHSVMNSPVLQTLSAWCQAGEILRYNYPLFVGQASFCGKKIRLFLFHYIDRAFETRKTESLDLGVLGTRGNGVMDKGV